jgi:hypothetical protein
MQAASIALYLLHSGFLFGLQFNPEDGGCTFLWNVAWLLLDYTALYVGRKISSKALFLVCELYSPRLSRSRLWYYYFSISVLKWRKMGYFSTGHIFWLTLWPIWGEGTIKWGHISLLWCLFIRFLLHPNSGLCVLATYRHTQSRRGIPQDTIKYTQWETRPYFVRHGSMFYTREHTPTRATTYITTSAIIFLSVRHILCGEIFQMTHAQKFQNNLCKIMYCFHNVARA